MNASSEDIANICVHALHNGNKILFCGNGGSAADSQHLAAELIGKLNFDRPPLAAIALTTDTSIITAIGNDYGFEHIFSRQIQALGKPDDVLIAMSTSGKSKNIIQALASAQRIGMKIIGLTGNSNGDMYLMADVLYNAPSSNTQEIQEYHMKLGHEFCGLIEKEMFAK